MDKEKISVELKEAHRMISKLHEDFEQHVEKETDLTIILLKGHLLVEHYLSHLVLLEYDKNEDVDKLSFFQKTKKMESATKIKLEIYEFRTIYKLNELRNRLAHNLEFKITKSEIDIVGFTLGRKYILQKYKPKSNEKSLLIWIIEEIAGDIFYHVYKIVADEKKMKPIPKVAETK